MPRFLIINKSNPAAGVKERDSASGVGNFMLGRRFANFIVVKVGEDGDADKIINFNSVYHNDIVATCEVA